MIFYFSQKFRIKIICLRFIKIPFNENIINIMIIIKE